ncbi:hypothetical protein CVT24_002630 [Panaeolus cyanescens]|uniref:F-box domain-containing protein n=1 Tax=Panaeolus cyanescens TaxID=181874 RepID=A0A409YU25_9AGAR|nr:hypothetical protein CVT24_002630 [Panaeolus cyanescens]
MQGCLPYLTYFDLLNLTRVNKQWAALALRHLRRRSIHLPPEIITKCLVQLDKSDLPSVALVNKPWSAAAQDLMYNEVHLRSDARNVQHTVTFFNSAPGQSFIAKIERAVLDTVTYTPPPQPMCTNTTGTRPWIPVDFLVQWHGLQVLELNGLPFQDQRSIELFSTHVTQSCHSLSTLVIRPTLDTLPMLPHLQIPGLKQIVFHYSPETSDMNILPLLTASQSTITHLKFTGLMKYTTSEPIPFHRMLTNMTFPSLIDFGLCPLDCGLDLHNNPNQPLTKFLCRSNNLQVLSFGRPTLKAMSLTPIMIANENPAAGPSIASSGNDNGDSNGEAPLPLRRIKSLSLYLGTSPTETSETIIRRVEEIKEGNQDPFSPFLHMVQHNPTDWTQREKQPFATWPFNNQRQPGYINFRDAEYVKVEFEEDRSHRRVTNARSLKAEMVIIRVKELCPNVAVLELKLVYKLDDLADHVLNYPSLEKLECLIVPRLSVLSPHENQIASPEQRRRFMEKIASVCPRLKYVVTTKPQHSHLPDCVFTLTREGTSEQASPRLSRSLFAVDQQFVDDGLEYVRQRGVAAMNYAMCA